MILVPRSQAFLEKVEAFLERTLPEGAEQEFLLAATRRLMLNGHAKRIRPLLVHQFGTLAGKDEERLVPIAAAAEMVHTASLLHDDVIDNANLRRGKPSANVTWGNTVAILAGDWLLALALEQLEKEPPEVSRSAVRTVLRMTEASVFEVTHRGRLDIPLAAWQRMAEGKTGSLFEWCARSAVAGTAFADRGGALGACAMRLAVGFQIADDLRDVTGFACGKDEWSDFRNRDLNAAILSAASHPNADAEKLRLLWKRVDLSRDEFQNMISLVVKSGAIQQTRDWLKAELEGGVALLGSFRGEPEGMEIEAWATGLFVELDARVRAVVEGEK